MKPRNRPGRPSREADASDVRITVRFSSAEARSIHDLSATCGVSLSGYLRLALLIAAKNTDKIKRLQKSTARLLISSDKA